MSDLKNKYTALKHQAIEMMENGHINGYLAKLVDLNDLRMQMIQMASASH